MKICYLCSAIPLVTVPSLWHKQ